MTPAERRRARARASVCRLFEARRRAEPSPPWRLPSLGRGPTPARLRRGERPSSLDLELLEAAPSAWGLALLGAWLWLDRARQAEEIVPRGYEVWQSEGWLR